MLCLKYRFSTRIFINRGNHETNYCNLEEGFLREIQGREGQSREFYDMFQKCFRALPLGVVIVTFSKAYFVVHGGIPIVDDKPLSIKKMDSIQRNTEPADKQSPISQILWNDFSDKDDWQPSKRGGWGFQVGRSALSQFLELENIESVIRSHEETPEGWKEAPGCITGKLNPSLVY
ncbi:hypothetical protein FSARC_605 [Fusarium sarcochroum]|uniref:Serine/threonine-protein phosphatase n=1 Tax=Fusarium sarcochroum TaxID=1208366 RepID=A0A8H4UBQ5_9HYPO|nr:hypothetical protein FSARC_605 [Fusarium sarcochroum]